MIPGWFSGNGRVVVMGPFETRRVLWLSGLILCQTESFEPLNAS